MVEQVHVLWDCRVKRQKPMDIWKLILSKTGGGRPSSVLVLQPTGTDLPKPLCTVMRMTSSKMFVGEDSVEFCFLELNLLLSSQPGSKFIIVSDDVQHFVRAFREIKSDTSVMFFTNQKLQWPLSDAPWIRQIQFVDPSRGKN